MYTGFRDLQAGVAYGHDITLLAQQALPLALARTGRVSNDSDAGGPIEGVTRRVGDSVPIPGAAGPVLRWTIDTAN
jgi:hypothetical protein